mmetsp:Transcript_6285/g.16062  ORF Transcript_6285/g.16062 Transcript_6285/m.16062 type:complete len:295 (-) Transcript_6285:6-890(-)
MPDVWWRYQRDHSCALHWKGSSVMRGSLSRASINSDRTSIAPDAGTVILRLTASHCVLTGWSVAWSTSVTAYLNSTALPAGSMMVPECSGNMPAPDAVKDSVSQTAGLSSMPLVMSQLPSSGPSPQMMTLTGGELMGWMWCADTLTVTGTLPFLACAGAAAEPPLRRSPLEAPAMASRSLMISVSSLRAADQSALYTLALPSPLDRSPSEDPAESRRKGSLGSSLSSDMPTSIILSAEDEDAAGAPPRSPCTEEDAGDALARASAATHKAMARRRRSMTAALVPRSLRGKSGLP